MFDVLFARKKKTLPVKIFSAITSGKLKTVKQLMRHETKSGASYSEDDLHQTALAKLENLRDSRGRYALFCAIDTHCEALVAFLANRGLNLDKQYRTLTPADYAISKRRWWLALTILDAGGSVTYPSLQQVFRAGQCELIKRLLPTVLPQHQPDLIRLTIAGKKWQALTVAAEVIGNDNIIPDRYVLPAICRAIGADDITALSALMRIFGQEGSRVTSQSLVSHAIGKQKVKSLAYLMCHPLSPGRAKVTIWNAADKFNQRCIATLTKLVTHEEKEFAKSFIAHAVVRKDGGAVFNAENSEACKASIGRALWQCFISEVKQQRGSRRINDDIILLVGTLLLEAILPVSELVLNFHVIHDTLAFNMPSPFAEETMSFLLQGGDYFLLWLFNHAWAQKDNKQVINFLASAVLAKDFLRLIRLACRIGYMQAATALATTAAAKKSVSVLSLAIAENRGDDSQSLRLALVDEESVIGFLAQKVYSKYQVLSTILRINPHRKLRSCMPLSLLVYTKYMEGQNAAIEFLEKTPLRSLSLEQYIDLFKQSIGNPQFVSRPELGVLLFKRINRLNWQEGLVLIEGLYRQASYDKYMLDLLVNQWFNYIRDNEVDCCSPKQQRSLINILDTEWRRLKNIVLVSSVACYAAQASIKRIEQLLSLIQFDVPNMGIVAPSKQLMSDLMSYHAYKALAIVASKLPANVVQQVFLPLTKDIRNEKHKAACQKALTKKASSPVLKQNVPRGMGRLGRWYYNTTAAPEAHSSAKFRLFPSQREKKRKEHKKRSAARMDR